ncbi:MAG: NADH-quinone oxidoreductase subunit NuoE [candidate division WOR-3 bacterium]|nr:NADH-quinone oxidoreductase subunit NuoE [candidate division WOR-3 bacterium]
MAERKTPPLKPEEYDEFLVDLESKFKLKEGSLIPVLQTIQGKFGYIPKELLKEVSDRLNLQLSKLYGVATFYAQFSFTPKGKHIVKICHGTACHVKGSVRITDTIQSKLGIQIGETTNDGLFTIERVACFGCCSLAPVMMVDGKVFGHLSPDKAIKILNDYKEDK